MSTPMQDSRLAEAAPADSRAPEAARGETPKAETPKAETGKAETGKAETGKAETGTPQAGATAAKAADDRSPTAEAQPARTEQPGKPDTDTPRDAKARADKADKADKAQKPDARAETAKKPDPKPAEATQPAPTPDPKPAESKKPDPKPGARPAEAKQPDAKPDAKPADSKKPDPKPDAKSAEAKKPLAGRHADMAPPMVAPPARPKRRHMMVLASFILVVLLPSLVAVWYLYARAVDQYASVMAFTVRSEDTRSALDVIGRFGGMFGGGGGSTDAEILYQFIQSQELVGRIDAQLDLRDMFSRHHHIDPVFGFRPGGTIEDLTDHWGRMLRIAFDAGAGLMEIRVLAFDPQEAQTIARTILAESTQRINELSAIAREDATRHAREDLDVALERLRQAREAVTEFRIRTRIVDPTADIQGQMGLLNTLQGQMAAAMIELDLLRETTRETDPRITQAERRIEVIRARIEEERGRFGGGQGPGGEDYATVVAEFERLNVDREFAEQAYRSAMSAYDAAVAEAQRSSRYLAAHITPTLAESARYPERETLAALTVFFLLLGWSVAVLIAYSIRDSR